MYIIKDTFKTTKVFQHHASSGRISPILCRNWIPITMEHFSRRRWTTIPAPLVSYCTFLLQLWVDHFLSWFTTKFRKFPISAEKQQCAVARSVKRISCESLLSKDSKPVNLDDFFSRNLVHIGHDDDVARLRLFLLKKLENKVLFISPRHWAL